MSAIDASRQVSAQHVPAPGAVAPSLVDRFAFDCWHAFFDAIQHEDDDNEGAGRRPQPHSELTQPEAWSAVHASRQAATYGVDVDSTVCQACGPAQRNADRTNASAVPAGASPLDRVPQHGESPGAIARPASVNDIDREALPFSAEHDSDQSRLRASVPLAHASVWLAERDAGVMLCSTADVTLSSDQPLPLLREPNRVYVPREQDASVLERASGGERPPPVVPPPAPEGIVVMREGAGYAVYFRGAEASVQIALAAAFAAASALPEGPEALQRVYINGRLVHARHTDAVDHRESPLPPLVSFTC